MDFNKIKEMGLEYAEKGRNAAMDLAERGRTQAKMAAYKWSARKYCSLTGSV